MTAEEYYEYLLESMAEMRYEEDRIMALEDAYRLKAPTRPYVSRFNNQLPSNPRTVKLFPSIEREA